MEEENLTSREKLNEIAKNIGEHLTPTVNKLLNKGGAGSGRYPAGSGQPKGSNGGLSREAKEQASAMLRSELIERQREQTNPAQEGPNVVHDTKSGQTIITRDIVTTIHAIGKPRNSVEVYHPSKYNNEPAKVNWGSIGSVSPQEAEEYAQTIITGAKVANELNNKAKEK